VWTTVFHLFVLFKSQELDAFVFWILGCPSMEAADVTCLMTGMGKDPKDLHLILLCVFLFRIFSESFLIFTLLLTLGSFGSENYHKERR
jgi:hypothetical protein